MHEVRADLQLQRIPGERLAPEAQLLARLATAARLDSETRVRVRARAEQLIARMRASAESGSGVERFLQEYRLSTPEGIALLSLAEAFLRIPDRHTADELIRDKLGSADWRAHLGQSSSTLVNASTLGLLLGEWLVSSEHVIGKLIAAGGEPFLRAAVRAAMRIMAGQFVMGADIEAAISRACDDSRGFSYSFDMLGEGARTAHDAQRYLQAYLDAVRAIGASAIATRANLSVKLSALHPRFELSQTHRVLPELTERLLCVCVAARDANIGITVDAEETERLDLSLNVIARVAEALGSQWNGFGLAIQAYQKRASDVIAWVTQLAANTGPLMVRLVKGAYWDTEIKRAQERGLSDYPVFTRKAATDVSYLACARQLLAAKHVKPAFATHNALTVATLLEWAGGRRDFEFQRLHGMGDGLYDELVTHGYECRIYAPVGPHRDLLAYLVRRLLENGANTSFVHQLADESANTDALLIDPVERVERVRYAPHRRIPPPSRMFGDERKNSRGYDLGDPAVLASLQSELHHVWAEQHQAAPRINGRDAQGSAAKPVLDPSDERRVVGQVAEASSADVARAVEQAHQAFAHWSATPVQVRAQCLERAADLFERDSALLLGLIVREAGRTIPDAIAELREAVDFCRYYAVRAREEFAPRPLPGPTGERNELLLSGRGVFACISPWNFPLSIFTGQTVAALAAGNSVVAKPAPQTPLVSYHAVRLLQAAGIPAEVLHFVPGGAEVGQALVAHEALRGVAFTGSDQTAKAIAQSLAHKRGPIVPLIAETGGQNAMIVDSSALPEQVVADVIASGFQSAGQRCSALRVLWLQEDSAQRVLEMLIGAMQQLVVGDPGEWSTDVGPVIDASAHRKLSAYIAAHRSDILYQLKLTDSAKHGHFLAPTLLRVRHAQDVIGETFGPIVHVLTWPAGQLERVIDDINSTGYGLTLGVHTRLKSTVDRVRATARCGNLYVNRSMIGAVVGVQPFGGEGLSGTGPKAGGPHYLARFATERTFTIDTTSAGGNASLMTLDEE